MKSIDLINIHSTKQHKHFVKIKNRLKCYRLKVLPDTSNVFRLTYNTIW